jgi:lipoprotein-releasing system ATP-binding protein
VKPLDVLLQARKLSKIYSRPHGDVVVFRDLDFLLKAGDSVAVTGPSGSGKSTLLNLLGGLDRPTSGCVEHHGRELPAKESGALAAWRNRSLGFVFQFHFLLPDFTALENLLIPVRIAGKLNADSRNRASRLLQAMGLAARADHLPGELSGGEQQRVAVARAFMNQPEIVLADEPFGNLDQEKSEQLGQLLFEMLGSDATSLVIVTHDLALASHADRVMHLTEGKLVSV